MPGIKKRAYQSSVREKQAQETCRKIIAAARKLLQQKGYSGMTMEAVAQEAGVAVPTVYANFRSKTGLVEEILEAARFGDEYQNVVRSALAEPRARERLRYAPRIARRIHESENAILDLLRGAGALTPALARQDSQRECHRYESQRKLVEGVAGAKELRRGLSTQRARDILWAFTGRDLYRMLVRERGWTPQEYQDWLEQAVLEMLTGRP